MNGWVGHEEYTKSLGAGLKFRCSEGIKLVRGLHVHFPRPSSCSVSGCWNSALSLLKESTGEKDEKAHILRGIPQCVEGWIIDMVTCDN